MYYFRWFINDINELCIFAVCLVSPSAESAVSVNGSPARASDGCASRPRSGTDTLPSSVSEPVQTQQPCSLKASMSSDNVCSGLQGEGAGVYSHPGQGELPQITCFIVYWIVTEPTVTVCSKTIPYTMFFSCLFSCVQAGLLVIQQPRGSPTNPAVNHVLDSWVGLFLSPSVCISLTQTKLTVPLSFLPTLLSLSVLQYNLFIPFLLAFRLLAFYYYSVL